MRTDFIDLNIKPHSDSRRFGSPTKTTSFDLLNNTGDRSSVNKSDMNDNRNGQVFWYSEKNANYMNVIRESHDLTVRKRRFRD
jgi:hypothetical protein